MITFKPTRRPSAAVTRAQIATSDYKVGAFYAIQPKFPDQEVLLVKCMKPSRDTIEGLILEKCSDIVGELVLFEGKTIEQISSEAVHSIVISINEISCNKFTIENDEYEQIIMSLEGNKHKNGCIVLYTI